jgi:hypothetical protein
VKIGARSRAAPRLACCAGEDVLMPSAERASGAGEGFWASAGWFCVVVLGAACAWALCLPVVQDNVWNPPSASARFHVEWFIAGAFLAVPIWYTARHRWMFGVPAVLITSVQMFEIADEGAHRLHQAGVLSAVTDLLYIAAALEIAVFVAVGVNGSMRNLADRRWAKLVAQLAALDARSKKEQF